MAKLLSVSIATMILLTWQLHLDVIERPADGGGGRGHAHAEGKETAESRTGYPSTTDEDGVAMNTRLPPQRKEIPRTIYLTSQSMNKVANERIQRMKNLHPGFSIEYYDDVRGREFILNEFGSDHVEVFDKIKLGQHKVGCLLLDFFFSLHWLGSSSRSSAFFRKADFLRYCLLFKFGGYYLDLDMFPIRATTECVPANLSSTLDLVSELAGAKHCTAACDSTSPTYNFSRARTLEECQPCISIHNGFMIARAGARLLRKLIDFMMRNPMPYNNGWMPCTHSYHFYVKAFYSLLLNETGSGTVEPNRVHLTAATNPTEYFLILTSFLEDPHRVDRCFLQLKNG